MTALDPATDPGELPLLLTVEEAARVLRIGRSHGCDMAGEYLGNGGTSGLPVIRLSRGSLRVPRWALLELITTGRLVRLCDAETNAPSRARAR